jgi:D-alanyl-D-alanine carboxypeptidase/D-alanyl-D-alanine-endopeptidase (penicillin-binding protein 4)
VIETNQESDNVYAESLLKTLGRSLDPNGADSSVSGVNAVKAVLTELGVNPSRYTMVDGSGLAERNYASAEALVQTLQGMASSPEAALFRQSLPIAGRSGTLSNRFRGTPAQGIVLAKTGTIEGVVSLSGYITPPNHPPLVFSIIVNSPYGASSVRAAVDEAVVSLTRLRQC